MYLTYTGQVIIRGLNETLKAILFGIRNLDLLNKLMGWRIPNQHVPWM